MSVRNSDLSKVRPFTSGFGVIQEKGSGSQEDLPVCGFRRRHSVRRVSNRHPRGSPSAKASMEVLAAASADNGDGLGIRGRGPPLLAGLRDVVASPFQ